MKAFKIIRNSILRAFRASDRYRWARSESLHPTWDERTAFAARSVKPHEVLIDVGAGTQVARRLVKDGNYVPIDIVKRSPDTIVCDLNRDTLPEVHGDVVLASGILNYVYDVHRIVRWFRDIAPRVIVVYAPRELTPRLVDRRSHGWLGDLSEADLLAIFSSADFTLEAAEPWDAMQRLFYFRRRTP